MTARARHGATLGQWSARSEASIDMRSALVALAAVTVIPTSAFLAWHLDARVDRWLLFAEVRRVLRRRR